MNPSHQVYFSGCNLRCEFCSVLEWIEQPLAADPMDKQAVLTAISQRRDQGARTLNLLGGEPTVNLPGILELLVDVPKDTTVVWNSNMYFGTPTLEFLDGIVDLYLADFKCGQATCARNLLGAEDYVEVVQACLLQATRQADMIVRHTPMPGHWDCCTAPILTWLGENLPQVPVSLRFDYVPPATAQYASLDYGTRADQDQSVRLAQELGLELVT